jgi:BirA family transcriptional regulator, biotin operon repressor / biotin---[acetyl-CoA-carboxylase] ligase
MTIFKFKQISSTNDLAKDYSIGSILIAETQANGHGRFKRTWSSNKGGIYLSIVLPKIDQPQLYTFIGCLAAYKAVKEITKIKTVIKWPNDLYYEKKKVCGILTTNLEDKTIVGIGINVNNKTPLHLNTKSTNLKSILKKEINKENILKSLIKNLNSYTKKINKKKIFEDWKKYSFLGDKVKVKTMNKTFEGIAYNLDNEGFLIIKKDNKKIKIIEGDVFIQ